MVMQRRVLLVTLPALAFGMARCSSPPPPPVLDLTVKGGPNQNPDSAGQAAPVVVHLYQLASTSKFEQADVFALTENESATLGTDLLGSESFPLAPSEQHVVKHELKKGTQALGVVVLFREIDHAKWRASAPVAASGPTKLVLTIDKLTATLEPAKS